MRLVATLVGLLTLALSDPAAAQCLGLRGASAPIICSDPSLRAQEQRVQDLSLAFELLDRRASPNLRLNDGWRETHEQCHDANCARFSYDYRIARLEEMLSLVEAAALASPSLAHQAPSEELAEPSTPSSGDDRTADQPPGQGDVRYDPPEAIPAPATATPSAPVVSTAEVQTDEAAHDADEGLGQDRNNDFGGLLIALVAVLGAALYALPSIIAIARGHAYRWVILAINLVAGWTLLGWLGSMVWAVWPSEKALVDPLLGSVTGTGERNAGDVLGEGDVSRGAALQRAQAASGQLSSEQLDQLERLGRLRSAGVLTEAEFVEQRAAVLA